MNDITDVINKIDKLEKWCENHEKEGQAYGREFEVRDEKMMNDIKQFIDSIENRLNILHNKLDYFMSHFSFKNNKMGFKYHKKHDLSEADNQLRLYLKEERQKRKLSIRKFADAVGVSFSSIARAERGEGSLDSKSWVKIKYWILGNANE